MTPLPFRRGILGLLALLVVLISSTSSTLAEDWQQWRGSEQNGVAPDGAYPTSWTGESAAWSQELPGRGGSTPVTAGNFAFLTFGEEKSNHLACYDLKSGVRAWTASIGNDRGNKHAKGSGSNPSPVTDGDGVFAYFRSGDLACFEVDGEKRWSVNTQELFGEDSLWWDLGTSPLLLPNAVVVTVMQSGPSYIAAFDKQTGKLLWKVDRMLPAPNESAQSYTTPVACKVNGEDMFAICGADHLTLHRQSDGSEVGRLGGFNPEQQQYFRSIASPVVAGDIIVCPYARGGTLTAVSMSDLVAGKAEAAIRWMRDDLGSDVPTPSASNGRVYIVRDKKNREQVVALDAETGKTVWEVALPRQRNGVSSSPLVAGDHLYVVRENGLTHVVGPLSSAKPEIVASNTLPDEEKFTVASPVPVDGGLLLRTRNKLWRFE